MENEKLQELERRLFDLERSFDKNLIDFETYIRQRSLLIQKKNNIISDKERERIRRDKVRYEFIKTYSI